MSAQPARAHLGIGEVLARLRGEFPDVSVSKIRFLESEGLIEPARSPSGYRRFDAGDLERLRFILTAQRDQYLPLRVIKERLLPPVSGSAGPGAEPGPPGPGSSGGGALSRRELLAAADIDDQQLSELETFGLVRRVGRVYSRSALQIACAAAVLGRYGVEARHLRAVRQAVEREISFIEQVIAPTLRQRNPEAREQAARTAREIAAVTLRLHGALLDAALAEAGVPGYGLPGPGAVAGGTGPAGRPADGAAPGTSAGGGAAGGQAAGGAAGDRTGYPAGRPGAIRRERGFGGASA